MGDVGVIPLVDEGLGSSAYLLDLDDGRALAVDVSRDLVGSAARTDLASPERTEELARAQHRSLQRLAKLDDDVAVWPTTNTLLRAESEDVFVRQLLDSLGTFPPYFPRLGEVNRRGPSPVAEGDVRPVVDFGAGQFDAGHVPGARHIELGALSAKASELPAGPTVVMCGHSEGAMGAASLLAGAGRSDIVVLDGGPQDWADATGESLEVGA